MSISLEGLDDIYKRLKKVKDTSKFEANLGKACLLVERAAKEKAPKGVGDLRRSIESEVKNLEGHIFTPLEYAPYVEFGTGLFAENGGRTDVPWCYQDEEGEWHSTSGMKPQPFLRPALEENRENILRLLKEGLTK